MTGKNFKTASGPNLEFDFRNSLTPEVPLGDVLSLRREVIHPRDSPTGNATFVGLEHIAPGTGVRVGSVETDLSMLTGRKPRFRKGDVVYGYLRPYLNKVWVADFDGICSVDQYVYCVDETKAVPEYVAWFMRSPLYLERAPIDRTPGQLPRLRTEEVANVEMPLPSLDSQQRLAEGIRAKFGTYLTAKSALEDSIRVSSSLLEKTLSESFHDLTPLSVGRDEAKLPKGWEWRTLTDLARLESGHTPSRRSPEYWTEGNIPWLALPDIRALDCRVATATSEKTNALGIANSSARLLPPGTVALSRTASVGFVTRFGCEMATSQDFVNWVCGPALLPAYLMWLLRASRRFIRGLSTGAIHQTVYTDVVKRFRVCLPDPAEQERISARLDEAFALITRLRAAQEDQLAALDRLPAAFLREAFGSLESKDAP